MTPKFTATVAVVILLLGAIPTQSASAPTPPAATDPEEAETYFRRGNDKFARDPAGAVADFSRAIELNPKQTDAYNMRGLERKSQGDLDGAIDDYSHAIQLDPNNASFCNNRGEAKQQKGDLDGAITDYTSVIELSALDSTDSRNLLVDGYRERAEIYAKKRNYGAATKDIDKAIQVLGPGNQYLGSFYSFLGRYQLFDRKPREAISSLLEALKLSPDDVQGINIDLAHAYLFDNQFQKAKTLYLKNKDSSEDVVNDFKELQDAGVNHPDIAKIRALLPRAEPIATPDPELPNQSAISPNKNWEYVGGREPKIVKAGSSQVILEFLKEQDFSDECSDGECTDLVPLWAPDSKRFAFRYGHGRYYRTSLYQLRGEEWQELKSPSDNDEMLRMAHQSIAAQLKKKGLPRNTLLALRWWRMKMLRWLNASTATLYASRLERAQTGGPDQRNSKFLADLEAEFLFTLKFDNEGNWKIAEAHPMSEKETQRAGSW